MKITVNFKTGFIMGGILGLSLLVLGFLKLQNIVEKAGAVSNFDLHQLDYYDLDGNSLVLSDFKDKNILVNFWATWCGPCIKEFPILEETYSKVSGDFVFVMVSDESIDKIRAFAKNKPYSFVYAKTNNLILNGITAIPQSFVLDKNGNKKHHHPTIFEGSADTLAVRLYNWINE